MRIWFLSSLVYVLAVVVSGPIVRLVTRASAAAGTIDVETGDGARDGAAVAAAGMPAVRHATRAGSVEQLAAHVPWLATARSVSAAELFGPGLFDRVRVATIGAPPATIGYVRNTYGRTACRPDNGRGGNPLVKVAPSIPRVGSLFEVEWTTVACVTPGPPPLRVAFVMVSLDPLPAPVDLTAEGATGCWLLVNPDFIVWPSGNPNALLSYVDGTIRLRWTPSQGLVGQTFFAQLMVLENGVNPANYVVSSAIEVCAGS